MARVRKHSQSTKTPSAIQRIGKTIRTLYERVVFAVITGYRRIYRRIETKPFTTFFTVILILFILIAVGSFLRKPQPEKTPTPPIKSVQTYHIGTAPTIHVQAQIEKSGIIKINALAPGIISKISVTEGQQVAQGAALVSLSSNYGGGNAAALQEQLAAAQYQNVADTYAEQKDNIQKQKVIADTNQNNTNQLRDITTQSINDTQGLVNLNNDILSTLDTNLSDLQNNNPNGTNDSLILSTKQQMSQIQATQNQLNASLRQNQYQNDTNNPPQQLATLQHDLTVQQLDIQQKALDLSLQTSKIQLSIAQVNEAAMYPTAPFAGTVERIYVHEGDSVNAGTELLLLHGAQDVTVVAKVPQAIAQSVSQEENSTITLPSGKTISLKPSYVSSDSTDGSLYSVIYSIPSEYQNDVADNGYLSVNIPVGYANTTSVEPFVPLDSVYQSQSNAYVFIDDHGVAKSKTVTLGQVYGDYVAVDHGLSNGDQVIVSRTVLNGDKVTTQ